MTSAIPITLGTRGSALALAQADLTTVALQAHLANTEVTRKIIKTTGDIRLDISLTSATTAEGGKKLDKGLFTKEIETELLAGNIDIAVHSLKDLPTTMPTGLTLAAVLPREATDDLLISTQFAGLDSLPKGALIATGSERRRLQLLDLRPDLKITGIRGNVQTRLGKLRDNPDLDGLLLARAGMIRLGYTIHNGKLHVDDTEYFVNSLAGRLLPAPGQGAVGLQCRLNDPRIWDILTAINHAETWACVRAERSLLKLLGGGCQMPLGVAATIHEGTLFVTAELFRTAGAPPLKATISGQPKDAVALGAQLLEKLYDR